MNFSTFKGDISNGKCESGDELIVCIQTILILIFWDSDSSPKLSMMMLQTLILWQFLGCITCAGAYFILSLMDRYYEKNMSVDKALELVDKCIAEVRARLVVAPPNFVIKIVDKDGARTLAWRKTVEEMSGPPSQ